VTGSARGGRIVRADVTAYVKSVMTGAAAPASSGLGFELPPPPKVDFSRYGAIETQPLSKIQKVSGAYLHRNWVSIPHVTQNDLADITDMEAYRKANSGKAQEQGFKLTPLVFLIKASVAALKEFPFVNASLDESGENLVLKKYFHIGIAVDTPNGLVVPVIRDCDTKDIFELAAELAELSQRAREGKLSPVEMQGACFTISSLGGIGGTSFTPIINAPEVAILGVSRSSMQPRWDGESFEPRMMLPLCLSYDHRVIDGANGARFTRYLAECLEQFEDMDL
jgi:pyruvate dehydrogenase E2 component (dihydrolipoamide acetyltransferase)